MAKRGLKRKFVTEEPSHRKGIQPERPGLKADLLVSKLGWSREKASEARARLLSFEEDWSAPGMDDYDNL